MGTEYCIRGQSDAGPDKAKHKVGASRNWGKPSTENDMDEDGTDQSNDMPDENYRSMEMKKTKTAHK